MTKLELESLQIGDLVIAVDTKEHPEFKWSPQYQDRPVLGKIYKVSGVFTDDGYEDVAVEGVPGQWMRERFIIINSTNQGTEEERQ